MPVDTKHPPLTYLQITGGSPFIAADRATNRLWRGMPCSAILSGLVIPGSCVTDADGFRWKMQSTTAPNGTFCVGVPSVGGPCVLLGQNSGPTIPDMGLYSVAGCPGSPFVLCPAGVSLTWEASIGSWVFSIATGVCSNGLPAANGRSFFYLFLGISTEKCFPMTFTNILTAEGPTTAGALGLPSAVFGASSTQYVAMGKDGTATVTLDDCYCP